MAAAARRPRISPGRRGRLSVNTSRLTIRSRLSAAATLPVALGFARAVRKFDKLKRPVPDALVHSFWYQRARAASEANRAWVEGLMKSFDAQRGRILLSSFLELEADHVLDP